MARVQTKFFINTESPFNKDYKGPAHVVRNWKEVYEYITGV